jgi:hypothetical protein
MVSVLKLLKDYLIIKRSGLFDPNFYREQIQDQLVSRITPLTHYLLIGGFQNLNPNKHFDSGFYLRTNPDVSKAKINPFVHYITHGKNEGRLPYPDYVHDTLMASFHTNNSPIALENDEGCIPLLPEFSNWNKNEVKLCQQNNQRWMVASVGEIKFVQREILATQLGKPFVNVVDVAPLNSEDIHQLFNLGLISHVNTPENTLLRRLAQSYTIDALPCKSLDSAAAGEFVFSVWIRRNDPNEYNRVYLNNLVPVFFDLNASMNFEGNSENIEDFLANQNYGHAGWWRVRTLKGQSANTLSLRQQARNFQFFTIHSSNAFKQNVVHLAEKIKDQTFDYTNLLSSTGFIGREADDLHQFLSRNQSNLINDVLFALDYVFSFTVEEIY